MKKSNLKRKTKNRIIILSSIVIILCAAISATVIFSNNLGALSRPTCEVASDAPPSSTETSESTSDDKNDSSDEKTVQTFNNKSKKENKPSSDESSTKGFDFSSWNKNCDFNLTVINKDNPIPSNFDLQLSSIGGNQIHTKAKDSLEQMFNDAKKDGMNLYISSGYRSIERQTMLFNRKVSYFKNKGLSQAKAEIEAAKIVARPKTSEHNSGLAVDLNGVRDDFYKTNEFKWLMNNSYKYGFILRYPKDKTNITNVIYEPWHFRFVGKEHAQKIVSKNICLEEYIESLI